MMAAKAATPAMTMEPPRVLAAPLKGVIGELDGDDGETKPVEAGAVPEGAGAPGPAGTETTGDDPGGTGTLPPAGG